MRWSLSARGARAVAVGLRERGLEQPALEVGDRAVKTGQRPRLREIDPLVKEDVAFVLPTTLAAHYPVLSHGHR